MVASGDAVGWTFRLAAVSWQVTFAQIDGGDPTLPKNLDQVKIRTERGSSGASTAYVTDAIDGTATFSTENGAAATTIVSDSTLWSQGRIKRTGRAHQLKFYGVSVTGDPQITELVAVFYPEEGNI